MSQPEQPDLRALPARNSATPSNDHQPQDLANVVSNAESVDLQISMDFYSVDPRWYMNPALRVPLEFATGCLILSRYPRRPGLGRRVTLLGLACGSRYLGETSQARLLDTAQDAYNLPLDVPEKQFWRRIMGAVICDDKRTVAWRHVVRRTASRWAEEPTEYYALAVQSMRRLEWNSITMLPVGSRYTQNNLRSLVLAGNQQSRVFWAIRWIDALKTGKSQPEDVALDMVHQVGYLSMLESWDKWQAIHRGSGFGMVFSAAVGIAWHQKWILRLSLVTGVCSLAASFLYPLALRQLLDSPSKLTRCSRDVLESVVISQFPDPLQAEDD